MPRATGTLPGPCTATSCASAASTPAEAMSGLAAATPEIFRKSRRETPDESEAGCEAESFADENNCFEDGCFAADFFFLPSGRSSTIYLLSSKGRQPNQPAMPRAWRSIARRRNYSTAAIGPSVLLWHLRAPCMNRMSIRFQAARGKFVWRAWESVVSCPQQTTTNPSLLQRTEYEAPFFRHF